MDESDKMVAAIIHSMQKNHYHRARENAIRVIAGKAIKGDPEVSTRDIYAAVHDKRGTRNVIHEQIDFRIRWLLEKGIIHEMKKKSKFNRFFFLDKKYQNNGHKGEEE